MKTGRFLYCFGALFFLCSFDIGAQKGGDILKIPADRMAYIHGVWKDAVKKQSPRMLAEAWYLYGKTYAGIGDFKAAQIYFFKSLKIQEGLGDSYEAGRLYIRMGEIETIQGNFQRAAGYVEEARKIFERVKSSKGMLSYYQMVGVILDSRWNEDSLTNAVRFDSLLHVYQKVENLASQSTEKGHILALADASLKQGKMFVGKNPVLSIRYARAAFELYRDRNKTGMVSALVSQTPAYIRLHEYSRALQALTLAEKYYRDYKINDLLQQVAIHKNYVDYFQAIRDWKNAFKHEKILSKLEKEKIVADRNGAIARLTLEYNAEKKEKQLRMQQKELALKDEYLRTQRYFIWVFVAVLVLALGVGIFYFRLYRLNQKTNKWNEELLKEQNHRVKNNLQVVLSLLNLQSKRLKDTTARLAVEETRLRVESMAILNRKLYDGEMSAEVELSEFIQEVVYCVVRSFGFDYIRFDFDMEYITLNADKAVRFGLIVNELSTNACKYAFPGNIHPQYSIHCYCVNQTVNFSARDNGPGMAGGSAEACDKKYSGYETLGVSLIQALTNQLGGTCSFSAVEGPNESGVVFCMSFEK